jgi:tetratricopeptide (TPR) repeat protein
MIEFMGGTAVPVKLREDRDFRLDAEELAYMVNPRTKLIIINTLLARFAVIALPSAGIPGVSVLYIGVAFMIVFGLWFGGYGAIAAYRGTEKGHPDYSEAHHRLATIYLDDKNDYDAAIREFENVLSLPENQQLIYKQFSVAFTNLGHAYYEKGNALVATDKQAAAQNFALALQKLQIAKQNTRFFPTMRYDEALHDTYYYLALSYHKLYLITKKATVLNDANTAWREYFDSNAGQGDPTPTLGTPNISGGLVVSAAGGSGSFFFHYMPSPLRPGCRDSWGTFGLFQLDPDYNVKGYYAQYFASQILTREWAQPVDEPHRAFRATSDVRDASGNLLVTAYADIREAVGAMRDGAVNYLAKPIDLDELLDSVREATGLSAEAPLKLADDRAVPVAAGHREG